METTRPAGRLERTLRNVFGIDKLRPGQEEVIRSVLSGQYAGAHTDGCREIALLSNTGASPSRDYDCDISADRSDERSGG
jgi:superfamily II DNA helicase RecQ